MGDKLEYIGDGAFLFHVPARDLTDEEIKKIESEQQWKNLRKTLVDSGLYREPVKSKRGETITVGPAVEETKKKKKEE